MTAFHQIINKNVCLIWFNAMTILFGKLYVSLQIRKLYVDSQACYIIENKMVENKIIEN